MKKINRKLSTNEHPVFTDESQEHLTVCDFRNGKLIHYFDPEDIDLGELILSRNIEDYEMDKDLENVAKEDFIKHYKVGDFDISTNKLYKILNFCRKSDDRDFIKKTLIYIYKNVFGKIDNPEILDFGKFNFGDIFLLLAILSESDTEKIKWLYKGREVQNEDSDLALSKIGKNILKNGLKIESIGFVIDRELFAYEFEFDDIDLDQNHGFLIDPLVFASLQFEVSKTEYEEVTKWFYEYS